MAYEYHYENGEANFGPPLAGEVPGGAHLTFDVILTAGQDLVALRRPEGLHDGPRNALYFPHGLIRFGETVPEAVQRLVDEQGGGVTVRDTHLYTMPTWVENNHWHICLNVVATIDEAPADPPSGVSEVVVVERGHPGADFGWWTTGQLDALFDFVESL